MNIIVWRLKIVYLVLLGSCFSLGLLFQLGFARHAVSREGAAAVPSRVAGPSRVALVIDDFGGYAAGIPQMMALPFPLTFAVMPYEEFARQQAEAAVAKGFEVIVHMPFEAFQADSSWYGRKYISASLSDSEIKKRIAEAFQILPMATGLSNHMGSKATADPRVMRLVLEEIVRNNRFFFDSKTAFNSPVPELTAGLGLPRIERNLFLDDRASPDFIREQLRRLMTLARQRGFAVGIGHVGPAGPLLTRILREEIPRYQRQGFRLVRLSEVISVHSVNRPPQPAKP